MLSRILPLPRSRHRPVAVVEGSVIKDLNSPQHQLSVLGGISDSDSGVSAWEIVGSLRSANDVANLTTLRDPQLSPLHGRDREWPDGVHRARRAALGVTAACTVV